MDRKYFLRVFLFIDITLSTTKITYFTYISLAFVVFNFIMSIISRESDKFKKACISKLYKSCKELTTEFFSIEYLFVKLLIVKFSNSEVE